MCAFSVIKRAVVAAVAAFCLPRLAPSSVAPVIPGTPGPLPTNVMATNVIHFQSTNYFVSEDAIQALITVVRDGPLTNADFVSIDYTMIDGTALSGVHYFKSSG